MDAETYDLVIRGGTVVDGSGGPVRPADVALRQGVIAAVGAVRGRGREEIDAAGLLVTPGFVDVHTHYDGQITWESRLTPSSNHGVTTVVMGNCGVGFAPARPEHHGVLVKLMEGVEDIPEVVMTEGVPWTWASFPQYLDALDRRCGDIDFAAQLPHSPLRVFVMGERGADLEPPTEDDLAAMRALTREAIAAGAIGVTTSRALAHRFRDGRLAPSVRTEERELMALAAGLADAGAGVFQILPRQDVDAADELGLMRRLMARSGRPLSFSLIFNPRRPENWDSYVAALHEAADAGIPLRGQFYPRPIGVLLGLDLSYHPFSLNPSYRAIADLPLAQKVAAMRDPGLRARLIAETPDDPNPFFVSIISRTDSLFPLGDPPNYHPTPDQSIAALAARAGVPPRERIYDALLEDDGRAILYAPSTADVPALLARTAALLGQPNAVVALGDGGAHYGMICDAAYPTYLLTARVGESGVGLSGVVRALSAEPAALAGFSDRGLLAPGFKADLNVIDPDRLSLAAPRVVRDLPAGGRRLTQRSDGYVATIVSGVVTCRNGDSTGASPGRLVRRGRSVNGR